MTSQQQLLHQLQPRTHSLTPLDSTSNHISRGFSGDITLGLHQNGMGSSSNLHFPSNPSNPASANPSRLSSAHFHVPGQQQLAAMAAQQLLMQQQQQQLNQAGGTAGIFSSAASGNVHAPQNVGNGSPSYSPHHSLGRAATSASSLRSTMTPAGGQPHGGGGSRMGSCSLQLNEADNIKVAVRVRPLAANDKERGTASVLQVADPTTLKVVVPGPARTTMTRDFTFHACLGPEVPQTDVMALCGIPQLLDAALAGYNVTIFAYGQTGSGKTYTMSGREEVIQSEGYAGDAANDGIITRSVAHLYSAIAAHARESCVSLSASYLEIYQEGVFDLLNSRSKNLPVKWEVGQGFHVPGLKAVTCPDMKSMLEVVRTGMQHRHVGSHELNIESSRSHSIMTIICRSTPLNAAAGSGDSTSGATRFGKISFVDLAGSERLKDSKSEGTMMKETANINKSLFVLGKVIAALADADASGAASSAHIPYRDSKLTRLLADSLGGAALALMIACCSPSNSALEESLSTLGYASRTKNIVNRPAVQYDPASAAVGGLRREIELLRTENAYLREQMRSGGGYSLPITPSLLGSAAHHTYNTCTSSSQLQLLQPPASPLLGFSNSHLLSGSRSPMPDAPNNPTIAGHSISADGYSPTEADGSGFESPTLQFLNGTASKGSTPRVISPVRRSGNTFAALTEQGSFSNGNSGKLEVLTSGGSLTGRIAAHAPGATLAVLSTANGSTSGGGYGSSGGGGGATDDHGGRTSAHSHSHAHAVHQASGSSNGVSSAGSAGEGLDLLRRLKETQTLLSRFSEENGRLARENDKLRVGRSELSAEHADVLDEIDALRGKLAGLESAVITGHQTPAAVRSALGGLAPAATGPAGSSGGSRLNTASGSNGNGMVAAPTGGDGGVSGGMFGPPLASPMPSAPPSRGGRYTSVLLRTGGDSLSNSREGSLQLSSNQAGAPGSSDSRSMGLGLAVPSNVSFLQGVHSPNAAAVAAAAANIIHSSSSSGNLGSPAAQLQGTYAGQYQEHMRKSTADVNFGRDGSLPMPHTPVSSGGMSELSGLSAAGLQSPSTAVSSADREKTFARALAPSSSGLAAPGAFLSSPGNLSTSGEGFQPHPPPSASNSSSANPGNPGGMTYQPHPPPHNSQRSLQPQQHELANVLTLSSTPGSSMRTRRAGNEGGGPGGSSSGGRGLAAKAKDDDSTIVVADRSKLSLLLGT